MSNKGVGIREGALARGDDANATDAGGTSRKDGDIDGTNLDAQAQKGAKTLAEESGNAAVKKAVKELENDNSQAELDLSSQAIGVKGAQALVVALQSNSSCHTLKLDRNRLSDFGANAFAAGLPSCTALKHLSMKSSQIRDDGASKLATCLPKTSLESLNLSRNALSQGVQDKLKNAKKSCEVTV